MLNKELLKITFVIFLIWIIFSGIGLGIIFVMKEICLYSTTNDFTDDLNRIVETEISEKSVGALRIFEDAVGIFFNSTVIKLEFIANILQGFYGQDKLVWSFEKGGVFPTKGCEYDFCQGEYCWDLTSTSGDNGQNLTVDRVKSGLSVLNLFSKNIIFNESVTKIDGLFLIFESENENVISAYPSSKLAKFTELWKIFSKSEAYRKLQDPQNSKLPLIYTKEEDAHSQNQDDTITFIKQINDSFYAAIDIKKEKFQEFFTEMKMKDENQKIDLNDEIYLLSEKRIYNSPNFSDFTSYSEFKSSILQPLLKTKYKLVAQPFLYIKTDIGIQNQAVKFIDDVYLIMKLNSSEIFNALLEIEKNIFEIRERLLIALITSLLILTFLSTGFSCFLSNRLLKTVSLFNQCAENLMKDPEEDSHERTVREIEFLANNVDMGMKDMLEHYLNLIKTYGPEHSENSMKNIFLQIGDASTAERLEDNKITRENLFI